MTARLAAVGLLLACAACMQHARAPERLAVPSPDGDARLSDLAVPTAYRLDVTVDPTLPTFSGTVWITVELRAPAAEVRLHGRDLDISAVEAVRADGAATAGMPVAGRNGGLALVFTNELTPATYVIRMTFAGRFADGLVGLYRVKAGEEFYAFTQFEALHARRAFPCFDEPRFKTPWEITLRVPHGLVAASNTPVAETRQEGTADVVRFAMSEPLPTYLVAVAVGPFDVVEGPPGGVPLRMLTVRGRGILAGHTLKNTPRILATLSDYFGRPYPFQKLDLVAVPDFGAGAMENAGLVTFRDTLVLMDPQHATAAERYECESVVAHELAHQWFGDLVTMEWWDDLWLNEGFATWMATKVLMTTAPEFHADLDAVSETNAAMQADSLAAARAVRQPIKDGGDVITAFDEITYDKGAAILRMLEAWVGEHKFRTGVRAYINAHAWGSARTADLFGALTQATGQPIAEVASTFVDQPGTPLLALTTVCDGGTTTMAAVQSRYLPDASHAAQTGPWHVPVCMRDQAGDAVQRKCVLITTEYAEVPLDGAGCPLWIQPNAAAAGYYRWRLPEPQLLALVTHRAQLNAPEQVALPGNLDALLVAAQLDGGTYLDALGYLVQADQRQVVDASVSGWHRLYHATVDYEGGAPADDFATYVRRSLGARADKLGMLPRSGEDPQTELLRATVIPTVADIGRDSALRTQASDLTRRFLRNAQSVPPAAARMAVPIAAHEGDARLHAALVTALAHAQTPRDRSIALSGLGNFRDPTLFERSLQLYLTDTLRVGDFWAVAGHTGDTPALQSVGFAWMAEHFDPLAAKLGDDIASSLPSIGAGFCDAIGRERVRQFFSDPAHQRPGSARTLAQTLESIDQCIELRARATDSVRTFLRNLE